MSDDHNVQILGVVDDRGIHQTHSATDEPLYSVYCPNCDSMLAEEVLIANAEQIRDDHEKEGEASE